MSKAFAYLGAGFAAALALLSAGPLSAQGYETPPNRSAAKVLPADLLQGPYQRSSAP